MDKNKKLNEIIGWYGAVAVLLAFCLVSFGVISPGSLVFQILNATGAFGIAYISYKKKVYQPALINVVWIFIALISIVVIVF